MSDKSMDSKMNVEIEKEWKTNAGYNAFITVCIYDSKIKYIKDKWRCGYVQIPKEHPWYGKSYEHTVSVEQKEERLKRPIGGLISSPMQTILLANEPEMSIASYIDVHGGVTFMETNDKGECWVGFDCNHLDDRFEIQTPEYCVEQCESMAQQLKDVE